MDAASAAAAGVAADEGVPARIRPTPGRDSFGEAWLSMRSIAFFTITLVLDADVVLRTCRMKHRNRSQHAIAKRFSISKTCISLNRGWPRYRVYIP